MDIIIAGGKFLSTSRQEAERMSAERGKERRKGRRGKRVWEERKDRESAAV